MSAFDRDTFEAVTAGDPELGRELADLFREDSTRLVEELEAAIAARDETLVGRTAHTLKSSAGSLGAMQASELAAKIEHEGMSAATEMFTPLKNAVSEAVTAMDAALQESGA